MGGIKQDQFDGDGSYYDEETYSKGLSREDTLEAQIRFIVRAYSKGMWGDFERGVKVLHLLLPNEVRKKFSTMDEDLSPEGVQEHYKLFEKIQNTIETETNMIWKRKFIKTFE